MSEKYFGERNPLGETIRLIFAKETIKDFKVTGVAAAFPDAHTIDFSFLINFENFRTLEMDYRFEDWQQFVRATFVQVRDPADIGAIRKNMPRYVSMQNAAVDNEWAISSFGFEPLATLHQRSEDIRDDISYSSKSNYVTIIYLAVISMMLLMLACINYVNMAIVSATKRLKEIGVRKSIGATRRRVIVQFLTENIVTTCFALTVGMLLGFFVFIPGFEGLWHFDMEFSPADPFFWVYLPAIVLLTCVASGIYPSLYISRFPVVQILKGSVKFGQRNPITRVFLTLQLILACIFVTGTIAFTANTQYLAHRPWGYDQRGVLYAHLPDHASLKQLEAVMHTVPDVVSTASAIHHLGKDVSAIMIHLPDRSYEVDQLQVDRRYLGTLGLSIAEGRVFHEADGSDSRAVVINELLAASLGWKEAIGRQFRIDTVEYEIVGVVKDFHSRSFSNPVKPTIFTLAPRDAGRYLAVRARSGAAHNVYAQLQASWIKLLPNMPFDGAHQEDTWGNYFVAIGIHSLVWRVFAFMAIVLATLGLYGLVRLNVEGRVREFTIRKVFGAGVQHIMGSIARQYLLLLICALLIGAPASYFLIKFVIETSYTYHVEVTPLSTMLAMTIILFAVLGTIATQVRKVFAANPVDGLKID